MAYQKTDIIKLFGFIPVVKILSSAHHRAYYVMGVRVALRKTKNNTPAAAGNVTVDKGMPVSELYGAMVSEMQKLPIYMMAKEIHSKIFPKYKNCNAGKDMVVLATGPSLDFYTAKKGALHMSVNKAVMTNKAKIDYIFVQDYEKELQAAVDGYKRKGCKKFYGIHYVVPGIAQCRADRANAERYCFIDGNYTAPWAFPPDISVLPFNTYASVIHPAVTFALWTGVRRLYLVGCDCSNAGYAKSLPLGAYNNFLHTDAVMYGWKKFKEYAQTLYPDTEIISINPVGLRGMFRDVYTRAYLAAHPEIDASGVEIFDE